MLIKVHKMKYLWKVSLEVTVYTAKCPRRKSFVVFTAFHSIANLLLQNMALSISNINLQNAIVKGLLQIAIFTRNMKVFSSGCFPIYNIRYIYIYIYIYMYINPNGIR